MGLELAPQMEVLMKTIHAILVSLAALYGFVLAATAQTTSPYVGQERRTIKALSETDIRDLTEGRGMGLAKAAELNSYPGPLHILELRSELGLSEAQRVASEALIAPMREKAASVGARIIEAEHNLDLAFAQRWIGPTYLRQQINTIAMLQGELRAIHLETHLAQREILGPEQIIRYNELRGYQSTGAGTGHQRPNH